MWLWSSTMLLASCGFGDNTPHARPTNTTCGNGVTDTSEACDDGNQVSGDGCSDVCAIEVPDPTCGNGTKEAGEACDDGNTTDGDGCSATCDAQSLCGNGKPDAGEACDDGNSTSGDGCSPSCETEAATACSLLPQGGCSGQAPACDFTAAEDGTTACRAVTSAGMSDSKCGSITACAAGYSCVGDYGDDAVCMPFCAKDGDCSGTGSRCRYALLDGNGDSLGVKVCSNACNVYAQTGCPTGFGCLGHEANGGDFTDCHVMGTRALGQTCQSTFDCAPGGVCVAGNTARCRAYCKVGQSNTCPSSQTCTGFSPALSIGGTTYGFCR